MHRDRDTFFVKSSLITELRDKITQPDLAARAGIADRTLQTMETGMRNGQRARIQWEKIRKLADALSVSPYDLVESETPGGKESTSDVERISVLYRTYRQALSESSAMNSVGTLKQLLLSLRATRNYVIRQGLARLESSVLTRLAEL